MKIVKCDLFDYKDNKIYDCYNIDEMNHFIKNDGSDYNLINIGMSDYKYFSYIRINFDNGLYLILTIEK